MTAQEVRDLELSGELITENDKKTYEEIMTLMAKEASAETPSRFIVWSRPMSRKIKIKLQQDQFQLDNVGTISTRISWELTNTKS